MSSSEYLSGRKLLSDLYRQDFSREFLDRICDCLSEFAKSLDGVPTTDRFTLYENASVAVAKINHLCSDFWDPKNELYGDALETLCNEFDQIAIHFGFDFDSDRLVVNRDW